VPNELARKECPSVFLGGIKRRLGKVRGWGNESNFNDSLQEREGWKGGDEEEYAEGKSPLPRAEGGSKVVEPEGVQLHS